MAGSGAAGLMDTYSAFRASTKSRSTEGYRDRAWPWDCIEFYIEQIAAMRAGGDSQGRPLGARIRQRRRAALIGEFQLRGGHIAKARH